jgi:hypothetical protein
MIICAPCIVPHVAMEKHRHVEGGIEVRDLAPESRCQGPAHALHPVGRVVLTSVRKSAGRSGVGQVLTWFPEDSPASTDQELAPFGDQDLGVLHLCPRDLRECVALHKGTGLMGLEPGLLAHGEVEAVDVAHNQLRWAQQTMHSHAVRDGQSDEQERNKPSGVAVRCRVVGRHVNCWISVREWHASKVPVAQEPAKLESTSIRVSSKKRWSYLFKVHICSMDKSVPTQWLMRGARTPGLWNKLLPLDNVELSASTCEQHGERLTFAHAFR